MADIRLAFDVDQRAYDFALAGPELATDGGIETAITLSLFSDRRAEPDDVLPNPGGDRRGWWGDAFPLVSGDQLGSRLWLLSRAKLTRETLNRARAYAQEALAWLVEDGVASKVEITAEASGVDVLLLRVRVHRPAQPISAFEFAWRSLDAV